MNSLIFRFEAKIRAKQLASAFLSRIPSAKVPHEPAVTIVICSFNTKHALQLTIESMLATTTYRNYRILVADDGSRDGSLEFLVELEHSLPLTVLTANTRKGHVGWLNTFSDLISTPYWLAVDSDVLFLGRDWLKDLIARMEQDPHLHLLSGECVRSYDLVWNGQLIQIQKRPAPWLCCIRTRVREYLKVDFSAGDCRKFRTLDPNKRRPIQEVGGNFASEIERHGFRWATMPPWYKMKYHHFGSMSWISDAQISQAFRDLKQHQLRVIRKMVRC